MVIDGALSDERMFAIRKIGDAPSGDLISIKRALRTVQAVRPLARILRLLFEGGAAALQPGTP